MSNDETRTVMMWLNNSEGAYGEACEIVERMGNIWDAAERLQSWLEQDLDNYGLPGVLRELLSDALRAVDWEDVAQDFKPMEWGDADEAPEDDDDEEDED